jgi:hypothetical protein
MMARRSAALIAAHWAISAMVRPQPMHVPVSWSSRQILTHLSPANGPKSM